MCKLSGSLAADGHTRMVKRMADQETYDSFFVRLTRPGTGASRAVDNGIRIEIEHFQSGEILILETQEAFFDFFRSFTAWPTAGHDSD
jgi:hypothetical protein